MLSSSWPHLSLFRDHPFVEDGEQEAATVTALPIGLSGVLFMVVLPAMDEQVHEHIEHLRLNVDGPLGRAHLKGVGIQLDTIKAVAHGRSVEAGARGR